MVGDSAYAALEFLHARQTVTVTVITRLRLDARLHESAPSSPGIGRPRKKGKCLPTPQQVFMTRMTLPDLVLFITRLADTLITSEGAPVCSASWYPKTLLTVCDALSPVPRHLWLYRASHLYLSHGYVQPE